MPNAQQMLELSSDLDAVIEASPDAVIVLTPDYVIARFNPAAVRQYGYPTDEIIGQDVRAYWTPDEGVSDPGFIDDVMAGAVVGPVIRQRKRRDGSTLWVSLTGVPIRRPGGTVVASHWHSRDVTAQLIAQRERDEQISRFTTAFKVSPIGMLVATVAGDHTMANPALCRMLGYSGEEFLAINGRELYHPEDAQLTGETIQSLRAGETTSQAQRRRRRHKDGHYVWVEETITVLERDPDSTFQLLVQLRDIGAELERERRTKFLVDHDHLTGLANRRAFERIAEKHQRAASDPDRIARLGRGSLLIVDLDGFKLYNDTHGHATGDRILVAAADALRGVLRDGDVAARVGGDEFAVLLRESEGAAAEAVAARLVEAIATAVEDFREGTPRVTASVGIADFESGVAVTDVAQRADAAMYRAKKQGRDRWSR